MRPRHLLHSTGGARDDGDVIEFDGGFHVVDDRDQPVPPAFYSSDPDSPRCFCLGAAIRIHTGNVLGHDPSYTGDATETVCAVYTRVGRVDTGERQGDSGDLEPHLNSIIDWNDSDERSYDDVRDLTAPCCATSTRGAGSPHRLRTRETPMKNSVINVNDHLIARLEELGQENLSPEELENVVKRADASVKVASALTANGRLVLDAQRLAAEHGVEFDRETAPMLTGRKRAAPPVSSH